MANFNSYIAFTVGSSKWQKKYQHWTANIPLRRSPVSLKQSIALQISKMLYGYPALTSSQLNGVETVAPGFRRSEYGPAMVATNNGVN